MIERETLLLFLVLLVGVTIIASILIKAGLERIGIPPLESEFPVSLIVN